MNSVARRVGAVVFAVLPLAALMSTLSCKRSNSADEEISHRDDYQQAYVYAFR